MRLVETWVHLLPTALRESLKGIDPKRSVDVLAAAVQLNERLAVYLSTLIGVEGTRALLRRSLALTGREQGWLAGALVGHAGVTLSDAHVLAVAELQGAEVVRDSSVAVLTHLVNLLVGFVGERLTLQVLQQAWPEIASMIVTKKEPS